jgi:hypothetical protein
MFGDHGGTMDQDGPQIAVSRPEAPLAQIAGVEARGPDRGCRGRPAGALLDESVVTRAVFAVGGTMFMVGATAYTLIHPAGTATPPRRFRQFSVGHVFRGV